MNCPRKCGGELRKVAFPELDGAEIFVCGNCEGAWYPEQALSRVGGASYSDIEGSALSASLVSDQTHKVNLDADVACPVCQQTMSRFHYALAPEVMLDECAGHGTWLDDGELGVILNSVAEARADIDEYRRGVEEKRKEMNMTGVAKGGGNPFALTLRVLNALFSGGKG